MGRALCRDYTERLQECPETTRCRVAIEETSGVLAADLTLADDTPESVGAAAVRISVAATNPAADAFVVGTIDSYDHSSKTFTVSSWDGDGQAPTFFPASPSCEEVDGIADGGVCCPAECGECGGSGCSERPGGSESCCSEEVSGSDRYCDPDANVMAPCVRRETATEYTLFSEPHCTVAAVCTGVDTPYEGCIVPDCTTDADTPYEGCTAAECTDVDTPYAGCLAAECTDVDTPYGGCIVPDCTTDANTPYEGCTAAECTDVDTPYAGCLAAECTDVDTPYAGCTAAECTDVDTPYGGCIVPDCTTDADTPYTGCRFTPEGGGDAGGR
jgi:hypothetical protein